jgi:hypothetical protein
LLAPLGQRHAEERNEREEIADCVIQPRRGMNAIGDIASRTA